MHAGAIGERVVRPRLDWASLARRARWRRTAEQSWLLAFLLLVSLPIILPYFWMVVISFTARSGGVSTSVLWTACAIIVPSLGDAASAARWSTGPSSRSPAGSAGPRTPG